MASTLPKQFPTTATSLRGLEFIFHKVPASFKADRVTDLRVNSPLIIPRFSLNSNSWAVLFPHLIRPFKSDQETITGRFPSDFGSWKSSFIFLHGFLFCTVSVVISAAGKAEFLENSSTTSAGQVWLCLFNSIHPWSAQRLLCHWHIQQFSSYTEDFTRFRR